MWKNLEEKTSKDTQSHWKKEKKERKKNERKGISREERRLTQSDNTTTYNKVIQSESTVFAWWAERTEYHYSELATVWKEGREEGKKEGTLYVLNRKLAQPF